MSITILIAPSGFKESLSVKEVTEAIAAGVTRAMPRVRILRAPMVDGGEGFTEALVEVTGGTMRSLTVTGPIGEHIPSFFGFLGGAEAKTAVIEMAAAAGLRLVPRHRRDPTRTTSFGVGELIRAALDAGAQRILIGCGDSGVNDGGMGMAQALGLRFLDSVGEELGPGGGELCRLAEPGSGASGGLGAGLKALLGAKLHPRYDIVMQYLTFETLLGEADLVITAEGSLDGQSPYGKVPCEVARRARRHNVPVIALAGTIGKGVTETFAHGIDAFASIIKRPCTLDEAIGKATKLLTRAAEDALRMIAVGVALEEGKAMRAACALGTERRACFESAPKAQRHRRENLHRSGRLQR